MENSTVLRLLPIALAFLAIPVQAKDAYVTDQFEVTMRSGTSTSNSITAMLKSGDKVEVLEEDVATQYSLVRNERGKQGYVLTRFLVDQPSARDRLVSLNQRSEQQKSRIDELQMELDEYRSMKKSDTDQIASLQQELQQTQQALGQLQEDTSDTVRVIEQNKALNNRINLLEGEKATLTQENARLSDTTQMDWFMRGAGVALGAFLIGIIVTRIRWRKQDSWGSY